VSVPYEQAGALCRPYFRVTTVEQRVEQKYQRRLLDPTEQAVIREALLGRAETMAQAARKEASRHARRLRELTGQQQKLVHLYYDQGVSKEVMKAEQERIEAEQAQVERWQAAAANEIAEPGGWPKKPPTTAAAAKAQEPAPKTTVAPFFGATVRRTSKWRRGRDSNPRWSLIPILA
jgi:hypothetical protein